jgi:hypothetical protein
MSFFDIKKKLDNYAYSFFNVMSDVVFLLSFSKRKKLKKNSIYKDKHFGERCFIVGTGPSILEVEPNYLDALDGEVVFAVNSFYKSKCLDGIVPSYYALLDNNYYGVSKGEFNRILDKYKESPPVFIADLRAESLLRYRLKSENNIFIYAKNYPLKFVRCDLTGNISASMNVVSFCVQAAMYMGFKEIYLLGCDYNAFCSYGGGHCYDDEEELSELPSYNLAFYLKYYYLTTEFHYIIRRTAKNNNVGVFNITDGSLLDAYPRKSISEVI